MVQARQSSKKRKASKTAVPVWAAAGVLAMGGGASANAPATDIPSQDSGRSILLAEQEVSDVSLGTTGRPSDRSPDINPRA
jgi:hypothetical protein